MAHIEAILERLNSEYLHLHETYEDLFWISYMGDHSIDDAFNAAKKALDERRSNPALPKEVEAALAECTDPELQQRAKYWLHFFSLYQTPEQVVALRNDIQELETAMQAKLTSYQWSYKDPVSGEQKSTSKHGLMLMMATEADEAVRKACYDGLVAGSTLQVDDYITLVGLRNTFAKALGYKNFYYYKAMVEEGMNADIIFDLFESFYQKTNICLEQIRELEKLKPGLRKPWNTSFMLAGDFINREEPYFPLDETLIRWGRSFRNLGIDYNGAKLTLDLLFRQGKWDNGFCHYPTPPAFVDGKHTQYRCNFTCNALPGKVGSGNETEVTLFHEGGHAAEKARMKNRDICLNTEYPPASTAWAETQSMFLDDISESIERRMRYAKNKDGELYPRSLYEEKVRALRVVAPKLMYSIAMIVDFEKQIYSAESLTAEFIVDLAKQISVKYSDNTEPYPRPLLVPHIYGRESSCSYHGYGLAIFGLTQWREYFYKKYGHIVDNPEVGKEMKAARSGATTESYEVLMQRATGKPLSPDAYIAEVLMPAEEFLQQQKAKVDALASVPENTAPVDLNAHITLAHGKETIATNETSFEDMADKFAAFVKTM